MFSVLARDAGDASVLVLLVLRIVEACGLCYRLICLCMQVLFESIAFQCQQNCEETLVGKKLLCKIQIEID